jgi:hypothetical protein
MLRMFRILYGFSQTGGVSYRLLAAPGPRVPGPEQAAIRLCYSNTFNVCQRVSAKHLSCGLTR